MSSSKTPKTLPTPTSKQTARAPHRVKLDKYTPKSASQSSLSKKPSKEAQELESSARYIAPGYRTALQKAEKLDLEIKDLQDHITKTRREVTKAEKKAGKRRLNPEYLAVKESISEFEKSLKVLENKRKAIQPTLDRLQKDQDRIETSAAANAKAAAASLLAELVTPPPTASKRKADEQEDELPPYKKSKVDAPPAYASMSPKVPSSVANDQASPSGCGKCTGCLTKLGCWNRGLSSLDGRKHVANIVPPSVPTFGAALTPSAPLQQTTAPAAQPAEASKAVNNKKRKASDAEHHNPNVVKKSRDDTSSLTLSPVAEALKSNGGNKRTRSKKQKSTNSAKSSTPGEVPPAGRKAPLKRSVQKSKTVARDMVEEESDDDFIYEAVMNGGEVPSRTVQEMREDGHPLCMACGELLLPEESDFCENCQD